MRGFDLIRTHQNLVVILVDDGSPDGSGWIGIDYALADRRVLVIHQENAGLSAARNAGLDEARGEFTTFVDGDDWIAPDMVSKLLWLASSHHAEIAIGAHWKTTGDATSVIGCVNGGDNTNELFVLQCRGVGCAT